MNSTNKIATKLRGYFSKTKKDIEIIAGKRKPLRIREDIYSPVPDIAVGPFAVGEKRYEDEYDRLAEFSRSFVEKCVEKFKNNMQEQKVSLSVPDFEVFHGSGAFNRNARCFIAIEVEGKSTTLKHVLGSVINAVGFGRVALLVAPNEERLRRFLRALMYLNFLKAVEKPSLQFENALVLYEKQLIDILDSLE